MPRNVSAFYHDPPLFIEDYPIDEDETATVHFDRFAATQAEREFACGLRVRVTTEGRFIFGFDHAPDRYLYPESVGIDSPGSFDQITDAALQRTQVMNAFLALLYSTPNGEFSTEPSRRMVVTPDLLITMNTIYDIEGGHSNDWIGHLFTSGFPATYNNLYPHTFDPRIHNRHPVSKLAVEHALAALDSLLTGDSTEGILLADLFLRGSKAYQDHNHTLSVIHYWTIIERLINILWKEAKSENRPKEVAERLPENIREALGDKQPSPDRMGRILHDLGKLSDEIHADYDKVRQARNHWVHRLKPISSDAALRANRICERLLLDIKGIRLIGAGRGIHY